MSAHFAALDFPEIDCLIDEIPPKSRISSSLDDIRALPPKRPHRNSCQINAFESRRKSTSSNRRSSRKRSTSVRKSLSIEQKAVDKKRRRVVYVVVGTFLFILFSCVLVVIVTLTHQTEAAVMNNTVVYYTFAPHPEVVAKATTSRTHVGVRKENEELMNSLAQDSTNHDSLENLTASVPVDLK